MILNLSKLVSEWLVRCNVIDDTDKGLYEYATYSLLIMISTIMIAAILGLIMGKFVESLVLIIPFMTIRRYSGGYHAKSLRICLSSSSFLIAMCISLTSFIKSG